FLDCEHCGQRGQGSQGGGEQRGKRAQHDILHRFPAAAAPRRRPPVERRPADVCLAAVAVSGCADAFPVRPNSEAAPIAATSYLGAKEFGAPRVSACPRTTATDRCAAFAELLD